MGHKAVTYTFYCINIPLLMINVRLSETELMNRYYMKVIHFNFNFRRSVTINSREFTQGSLYTSQFMIQLRWSIWLMGQHGEKW